MSLIAKIEAARLRHHVYSSVVPRFYHVFSQAAGLGGVALLQEGKALSARFDAIKSRTNSLTPCSGEGPDHRLVYPLQWRSGSLLPEAGPEAGVGS